MDDSEIKELAWKIRIAIDRKVTMTPRFQLNSDLQYALIGEKTGLNEAVNDIIDLLKASDLI